MKNVVVAIDGFSSCGKSTLAKELARILNYTYVDSGAMYRAVAFYFLENNIDIGNAISVENALNDIHIEFLSSQNQSCTLLNGKDVSLEIRRMDISEKVSQISPIKQIRTALVKQQQQMGEKSNIIMDGRDIGTIVFPHAQVKLFMTADPKIRAERRYKEILATTDNYITLDEIYTSLAQRDYNDTSRKESPLICAEDALILDNSYLSESEQLKLALDIIRSVIATGSKANSR